jgi:hypothetical protein
MHPDLARQCVVGPALFGHPAWNLAMVPAVGTHGHRIFTTVGLVDYGELLPRVGMKGIVDPDRGDTGSVPGYGNTFHRRDSSSSGATGSMPPAQRDDGHRCHGLWNEHRTDGRPSINAVVSQMILATSHCRMRMKRSISMRANAPGSSDSRSDIANPKGPASCKGLRGRSDGVPKVRRGDESYRRHRGSRRTQADPPTSDQDRAVPTGIRSGSPQLTCSSVRPFGRRVSVPNADRFLTVLIYPVPACA